MKKVLKGAEPEELDTYRQRVRRGSWDAMRVDAHYGGRDAYEKCRAISLANQGGLCAYCEISIRDNDPLKCRVEHFHPKSDITPARNWALDWSNLLAVCNGGTHPHVSATGFHREPTRKHLSCDAHKDQMIQSKKLSGHCEGWILNPMELRAFPNLFTLDRSNGHLMPDANACMAVEPWPLNQHATVAALVQHTIDMLNLNCGRLADQRLVLSRRIESEKAAQRKAGFDPDTAFANLLAKYLRYQWPAFFTTIRICLGPKAEAHLQAIRYNG
jgi:uncharacterized protein (TIGR02646 family)